MILPFASQFSFFCLTKTWTGICNAVYGMMEEGWGLLNLTFESNNFDTGAIHKVRALSRVDEGLNKIE